VAARAFTPRKLALVYAARQAHFLADRYARWYLQCPTQSAPGPALRARLGMYPVLRKFYENGVKAAGGAGIGGLWRRFSGRGLGGKRMARHNR